MIKKSQDIVAIQSCSLKLMSYIITFTLFLIIIPVIFQVASLLAALTHPSHIVLYDIVIYAPGDSLPCRRDPSWSF
ncbi:hypothetical protein EAE89_07500 [Photorhabdus heterorhabditis]|nr:hypothetical protein [Photorhabdus heterorhabditis]